MSFFSRMKSAFSGKNTVTAESNPAAHGSKAAVLSDIKTTGFIEDKKRRSNFNVDVSQMSFHQIARDGDVQLFEILLERVVGTQQRKKKLNIKDDTKLAPLHYASRYSHYDMMKALIENGANVKLKGEDDATPLHFLAKYRKKTEDSSEKSFDGNWIDDESNNCVRLLIQNGADVNVRDAMGLTPLHQACSRNNIWVVHEILQFPTTDLEVVDHQGMTALHLSCLFGRKKIVKLLLDAGAMLRCRDKDQATPFHLACAEGSEQVAQLLLNKAEAIASTAGKSSVFTTIDENLRDVEYEHEKSNKKYSKLIEKKRESISLGAKTPPTNGSIDLLQDTDNDKNLPLHLAIENGHLSLVKLCVKKGKEAGLNDMVKACRSQNDSCLHLAVQSNNLDIIKYLLEEKVDVNVRNTSLVTPLMIGCQQNSYHIVLYLLQNGANLESRDSAYMTPLMIACRFGHYETIQCLLENGANATETDKDDKNCLMLAAEENRTEALTLLLGKKDISGMIEERDKFNNTALHLASMKGHQETVKLLLEHRAATDTKNEDDRTTLHMAALYGHEVIIPDLINKDRTIINSGDEESNTALHLAAIGGNLKSVTCLIKSGANMEILNSRQWRPLDAAAAHGWEKIVSALLESGTNIEPRGKIKVSPLHLACQRGHMNVVKILLQWKADVTFKSSDGRNALDFAIDFGQRECVLALIKHDTWQDSMKNATFNPVTGRMLTPMRKLIMKMGDMAMIVCDQCITDNGKKPENDHYAVTLSYDFIDDMYISTEWLEKTKEKIGIATESNLFNEDSYNSVYDENGELTPEARTYSMDAKTLHKNHPLHIMVTNESESLLLHPVVTGLLNHKWRSVGRYIYYSNMFLYLAYMLILNCYMLLQPPYYRLDWVKIVKFRRFLDSNRNSAGLNHSDALLHEFENDSPACWYYRSDVVDDGPFYGILTSSCTTLPPYVRILGWLLISFAIFHLLRESFQLFTKKLAYFNMTNLIEVTLYVLSLLIPLQFSTYSFSHITQLTAGNLTDETVGPLTGFQHDTGLRQEWQQQVGAFSVFLSWMVLLLFIRKVPRLGIFVVMFTDILRTFSEFFVVFAFFIIGFALSFTILLGNQHEFELWYEAMVKTTVMMIGELDYASIFYHAPESIEEIGKDYHKQIYPRGITFILFFIFLLVVTIIIMNLLVGLAVGDIIEVRENATLETVGMQVGLTLDVEFTLPSFLRKSFFRRKQKIEVNKYRHSNFLKKFLFQETEFLESIAQAIGDEEKEQDEPKTAEDKVLSGLNLLRGRLSDVMAEQADLRQDVRGVRTLVRQSQLESQAHAKTLKSNIETTNFDLSTKIDSTRSGLTETTLAESLQTREKVDGTKSIVSTLKEEVENTKEEIYVIKSDLEKKIEHMQDEMISKTWKRVEERIQESHNRIEGSKKELMEALEDLKLILVKEKYMTRV